MSDGPSGDDEWEPWPDLPEAHEAERASELAFGSRLNSIRVGAPVLCASSALMLMSVGLVAFGMGPEGRWVVVGQMLALALGFIASLIWIGSGVTAATMKLEAPRWSAAAVDRLRRHGWCAVERPVVDGADLEVVALGPTGVVVLRSTWITGPVDPGGSVDLSAAQLRADVRAVETLRGPGNGAGSPVTPLVVAWGPEAGKLEAGAVTAHGGVGVVGGRRLGQYLRGLHGSGAPLERDALFGALRACPRKDSGAGSGAPTFRDLNRRWAGVVASGLLAYAVSFTALQLSLTWFVAVAVLLAAVGLLVARSPSWRPAGVAGIVGSQIITMGLITGGLTA